MKNVLILGAGKSSTVLIDYMLNHAQQFDWHITVGDINIEIAKQKINEHAFGNAIYFNVEEDLIRKEAISNCDLVISLLPAFLHPKVAAECVAMHKHFISASYVSPEMQTLHDEAIEKDIILLNEMGLDPGIDHMSAMRLLNNIRLQGGKINLFESYTGGLIAPECDNNPWNYKITWNPRNVILAGQGTAKFLWDGDYKYIPYQKLFTRYDILNVPGYGEFEGYPNRDSLQYRDVYQLSDIQTLVRGTLRKRGFCDAWNIFVQLGITDDTYEVEHIADFSWKDLLLSFLPASHLPIELNLKSYLEINDPAMIDKIKWLGLFGDEKINLEKATPAQALQKLIEEKLKLDSGDIDMCVMLHVIEYELNGEQIRLQSAMVAKGDDELRTAMAKTVGLPLGIAAKQILNGEITARGVVIPVDQAIYEPVLLELDKDFGIRFTETLHKK